MSEFLNNLTCYCKQAYQGLKQVKNIRLSSLWKVFSLMGKREKIAVAFLALLAIVNLYFSFVNFYHNHSAVVPAGGGSYTEGVVGQPTYINPLLANQDPDLSLTKLVFSGLYKYDAGGRLVPDLADGQPIISEDQKQYTVNLKRNVKWQNGKPFTADDVMFTIQTLQDQNFKSPFWSMWQSTTVEKLGDYSVKFTTKDISGPFIYNLTQPLLSKFIWGHVEAQNFLLSESNLKAVGTGPYAIREIKKFSSGKIDQITLQSSADYYGGKPKISAVTIKFYDTEDDAMSALESREIGGYGFVASGNPLSLQNVRDGLQTINIPLPQYQVAFFNLNDKILSDIGVRQALNLATDRRKIIDDVFKGQALLPTSPMIIGADLSGSPQTANPDMGAAEKLLDNAGWKVDLKNGLRAKKGVLLEISITTNDYPLNSKAAENLAGQWRQLRIKVDLSVLPTKQLTEEVIRPRKFSVLLFPQKYNEDPDPFVFWHSSQAKDPGFNLTGFSNPDADKLISEARNTTDQKARSQLFQAFDQILNSQAPAILLNQSVYTYAVSNDVKNIKLRALFEPNQRFYDLPNWYINEAREWK